MADLETLFRPCSKTFLELLRSGAQSLYKMEYSGRVCTGTRIGERNTGPEAFVSKDGKTILFVFEGQTSEYALAEHDPTLPLNHEAGPLTEFMARYGNSITELTEATRINFCKTPTTWADWQPGSSEPPPVLTPAWNQLADNPGVGAFSSIAKMGQRLWITSVAPGKIYYWDGTILNSPSQLSINSRYGDAYSAVSYNDNELYFATKSSDSSRIWVTNGSINVANIVNLAVSKVFTQIVPFKSRMYVCAGEKIYALTGATAPPSVGASPNPANSICSIQAGYNNQVYCIEETGRMYYYNYTGSGIYPVYNPDPYPGVNSVNQTIIYKDVLYAACGWTNGRLLRWYNNYDGWQLVHQSDTDPDYTCMVQRGNRLFVAGRLNLMELTDSGLIPVIPVPAGETIYSMCVGPDNRVYAVGNLGKLWCCENL